MAAAIRGYGMLRWDGATIGRNFTEAVPPIVYPLMFYPFKTGDYLSQIGYTVLMDAVIRFVGSESLGVV